MTNKINIAIIGECMVELRKINGVTDQSFGGDSLNTAVYVSRLTHQYNINTSYVTGLGKDPFSKEMLQAWQNEHINTDLVHIDETKTPGIYAIETEPCGERNFFYWRNDSAAKFWLRSYTKDELIAKLGESQWIYLSGISLAILPEDCLEILFDVLQICRNNGSSIAFDNNFRPALWPDMATAQQTYQRMLALTDIAFLTFDDEVLLWGDSLEQQAIERTQNFGVSEIVVKRGSEACFVVCHGEFDIVPANRIENVQDTTAAGDSFSGGYLAKRLTGGSPVESAKAGHLVAGTVIQHPGAIIPTQFMPTL